MSVEEKITGEKMFEKWASGKEWATVADDNPNTPFFELNDRIKSSFLSDLTSFVREEMKKIVPYAKETGTYTYGDLVYHPPLLDGEPIPTKTYYSEEQRLGWNACRTDILSRIEEWGK